MRVAPSKLVLLKLGIELTSVPIALMDEVAM